MTFGHSCELGEGDGVVVSNPLSNFYNRVGRVVEVREHLTGRVARAQSVVVQLGEERLLFLREELEPWECVPGRKFG